MTPKYTVAEYAEVRAWAAAAPWGATISDGAQTFGIATKLTGPDFFEREAMVHKAIRAGIQATSATVVEA